MYKYILPVIIVLIIQFVMAVVYGKIPENMLGWLCLTVISPLITNYINIDSISKLLCYYHNWSNINSESKEVIQWIEYYLRNHVVWKKESITELALTTTSLYWSNTKKYNRPQINEFPTGWMVFAWRNQYLVANYPFPESKMFNGSGCGQYSYEKKITIFSYKSIDWQAFLDDLQNYYYSGLSESRLAVYKIGREWGDHVWMKHVFPLRDNANKTICLNNIDREKCWDSVINFFSADKELHYKKLNQVYKTSYLIEGPPGTGKSEFIFWLASYLWEGYQIPVYILNTKGMDDWTFEKSLSEIQIGFVLVDEWDLMINYSTTKDGKYLSECELGDDKKDIRKKNADNPSLKAWHDILDRISGNVIFWFTTNNLSSLENINNGSLLRKGRIDHIFHFDNLTRKEAQNLVDYYMPNSYTNDDFKDIKDKMFSIGDIIANIKDHAGFNPNMLIKDYQDRQLSKYGPILKRSGSTGNICKITNSSKTATIFG